MRWPPPNAGSKRWVRAIEDGAWNDTLRRRLDALEAEKASLTAELAALARPAAPVRLHPQAAEIYRRKVAALEQCLNAPDIRHEAGEALRHLDTSNNPDFSVVRERRGVDCRAAAADGADFSGIRR